MTAILIPKTSAKEYRIRLAKALGIASKAKSLYMDMELEEDTVWNDQPIELKIEKLRNVLIQVLRGVK